MKKKERKLGSTVIKAHVLKTPHKVLWEWQIILHIFFSEAQCADAVQCVSGDAAVRSILCATVAKPTTNEEMTGNLRTDEGEEMRIRTQFRVRLLFRSNGGVAYKIGRIFAPKASVPFGFTSSQYPYVVYLLFI